MMAPVPDPRVGLVFRYDYLWHREFQAGRTTSKDRPACIVIARHDDRAGRHDVLIAAITHAPPTSGVTTIEIPHAEKRRLGLDDERSWLVLSELNRDWWPSGYTPVPGSRIGSYGVFTGGVLLPALKIVRQLALAKTLMIVDRS